MSRASLWWSHITTCRLVLKRTFLRRAPRRRSPRIGSRSRSRSRALPPSADGACWSHQVCPIAMSLLAPPGTRTIRIQALLGCRVNLNVAADVLEPLKRRAVRIAKGMRRWLAG